MIASFSMLKPKEISALLPELTVFLFPVGGIEQHGPHLPVGTKLFQAESQAEELAKILVERMNQWNFILMPLLPLTVDSHTNTLSLNVRPHVVRDAVVDQCTELARLKFTNFIVVSSQITPRQLCALEDAAKIVSRKRWFGGPKTQLASVSGVWVEPKQVFESPMISLPAEHGGAYDTGFILNQNPRWVDEAYLGLEAKPRPHASVKRFWAYLKNQIGDYWGHPALANAESAQKTQTEELKQMAEKIVPWLEKGQGQGMFRSGYGYFPFNGSFFKAYLLATFFFLMMLIFALWSMKDSFDA